MTTIFSLSVQKLDRSAVVFINKQNELTVLEVVSSKYLSGCDDAVISKCQNISLKSSNFRTTHLTEGIWYVSKDILVRQIEDRKTAIYKLDTIDYWKTQAPTELKDALAHCKRC